MTQARCATWRHFKRIWRRNVSSCGQQFHQTELLCDGQESLKRISRLSPLRSSHRGCLEGGAGVKDPKMVLKAKGVKYSGSFDTKVQPHQVTWEWNRSKTLA